MILKIKENICKTGLLGIVTFCFAYDNLLQVISQKYKSGVNIEDVI
ncbi:MAG: hypothetical protein ABIF18_03150 [archaeon]